MRTEETAMIALADSEGNYYLVSRETVQQGRVSPERQAELERVLGADEVSGYAVWPDSIVEANPEDDGGFRILGGVTVARIID
jgi:hypothetical protein